MSNWIKVRIIIKDENLIDKDVVGAYFEAIKRELVDYSWIEKVVFEDCNVAKEVIDLTCLKPDDNITLG